MLRARLITHSVEDSVALAAQLRERGYQVETVLVGDGSSPPARADLAPVDLEISLKEYSPEEALNRAGVQPIGRDLYVFIAPGAIAERSPIKTSLRPRQSARPEPVGEVVSAAPQRAPSHVPVTTNPPPPIIRPQLQRGATRAWRRVHLRLRLPVLRIPSLPDPRLLKSLPFWETASVSIILAIAVLMVGGFVSSRPLLPQDFSSFPATALHESAYTQASTTSHFLNDPNGGSAPPRWPFAETRKPSPAVSAIPAAVPGSGSAAPSAALAPSPEKVVPRRSPRRRSARRDDHDTVAQDFVIYYGKKPGSAPGGMAKKSKNGAYSDVKD